MSQAAARRSSDGNTKVRGVGNPRRRWLALVLIVLSLGAAVWVFNRDIDWKVRGREARILGLAAENDGDFATARRCFEAAVANNPYDWESHLSLADLLYHRLNDNSGALRHYYYALAYAADPDLRERVDEKVAILGMLRTGALENPVDALEEMELSVAEGAGGPFQRRLAPRLRQELSAYRAAWEQRGRGTVVYRNITNLRNGFYDAVLELDYADGTSMSMHFLCPIRDIWRLELSFP
jgi:tetratricopeptide (TPR) repeat protein